MKKNEKKWKKITENQKINKKIEKNIFNTSKSHCRRPNLTFRTRPRPVPEETAAVTRAQRRKWRCLRGVTGRRWPDKPPPLVPAIFPCPLDVERRRRMPMGRSRRKSVTTCWHRPSPPKYRRPRWFYRLPPPHDFVINNVRPQGAAIAHCNQRINQSINQSINRRINQSINQSINRSINQSINQSINRRITFFPFYTVIIFLSSPAIIEDGFHVLIRILIVCIRCYVCVHTRSLRYFYTQCRMEDFWFWFFSCLGWNLASWIVESLFGVVYSAPVSLSVIIGLKF